MEFLKINLETFKINPLLSPIDEEITVQFEMESKHVHDLKLKINIKVSFIYN